MSTDVQTKGSKLKTIARSLVVVGALVVGLHLPQNANASLILWTLSNATFNDGGSASGRFFYNADTATMTGFDVTTTAGTALSGTHYLDLNGVFPPYPSAGFAVTNPAAPPLPANALFIALNFQSALSNAGGSIALLPGGEGYCLDSQCAFGSYRRVFNGGSVKGIQVPEPSVLTLFAVAAAAMLLARRKLPRLSH